MSTQQPLWQQLTEAGITQGDAPPPHRSAVPVYVRVLQGFSGWVAAVFLMLFVGTLFGSVLEHEAASASIGLVLLAVAFALFRSDSSDFLENLGFAVSLVGQGLFLWSFRELVEASPLPIALIVLGMSILLCWLMNNALHRTLSAAVATFAFAVVLNELGASSLYTPLILLCFAWLTLSEHKLCAKLPQLPEVAYGMGVALVFLKTSTNLGWECALRGDECEQNHLIGTPWLDEFLIGAVVVYILSRLLARYNLTLLSKVGLLSLCGVLAVVAVSYPAPGLSIGLAILILGFSASNGRLMALGGIAVLYFGSSYYYFLEQTLMYKSGVLLATGFALLLAWMLFRTQFKDPNHPPRATTNE